MATKYACFASGGLCIICEITKSVYTVVFTLYIIYTYTYVLFILYIYIYLYSVVTRIFTHTYIYYTFVGIYETAEPARRDNNNNNNNFCRFHGKLYSDNYNTYTPLNALKVHAYVRDSFFFFVLKYFAFL